MIAVLPVAGTGTRLRPHTHTVPKALVPVAGKPIVGHIIDSLKEAGFQDFVFIIGYLGDRIPEYINQAYPEINATYVMQEKREGIAHAIWMTKEYVENENDLLIALGDTIFDMDMTDYMRGGTSALGVKYVDDPRRFGVVETDKEGFITKLVEKPAEPQSNLALVGIYRIKEVKDLFEAIRFNMENDIRTKGEYQLTDALMRMIDQGTKMTTYSVENWFDCGKKDALLETNAVLLQQEKYSTPSESVCAENSTIIPPVNIHPSAVVRNSVIGPNVALGAESFVENCIVRESLIGNRTTVRNLVLNDSVIGNDAVLKSESNSVNLGDHSEVDYQ